MAQAPKFQCRLRANFAIAFRNWRLKNHIPLKKIARELGVAISTVSSWESGQSFPTGYNFELLAEYTGLPPCRLFCVMADKCVPADCLLAMSRIASGGALRAARPSGGRGRSPGAPAGSR